MIADTRLRSLALAALATLLVLAGAAHAAGPKVPPADWILERVKTLSADDMEGRASGTPGADRAARYIARAFEEAGLKPGGDGGSYLQPFEVPTGIRLGPGNTLALLAPSPRVLRLRQDYTPLSVSADGGESGELVFAGYGITAPDLAWDDYAGLDVKGKIVLVLTREPRAQDPSSPFRRPEAYHYAERSHKIINARQHGARAILLVTHPSTDRERLPVLRGLSHPWGVLAAVVTRAIADELLAPSGKSVRDLANAIDGALAPRSFAVAATRLRLKVALVRERGTAANVIGLLPGTDVRVSHEAIVVGAHYDHLGRGGEGSLAPEQAGAIHHGADDNASGTSAVIALARAFAAGGAPRTLVFVAFAGEELGLLGSSHYVKHPAFPLDKTVLMVNLDMVGRLRDGRLYVGGVDSGSGLREVVGKAADGLALSPQLRGDPFSPSDHTSFYNAGRPVLFFFTGAHPDYHRPSDTWDKLSPAGLETVTTLVARVVSAVAQENLPPTYVKLAAPTRSGRSGGSGYGPFFGVVPEFGDSSTPGVKISGVRAGSPADKAGVKAGDTVVKFAGMPVNTLEDMTFVLRGKRAGDRVEVVILRDGQERRVEAVLEERQ